MLYPLRLKPAYNERIWGGRTLEKKFGKEIPDGKIGESWEVSCHEHGTASIAEGSLSGMQLTQAVTAYGKELLGYGLEKKHYEKFPLLIKFLDAEDVLSVQVHPTDEYARIYENGELGKTEAWYVVAAAPGARLVYGIRPGCTREEFGAAIKEGRLEPYLRWMEVKEGDVIYIPAGMVHAIGAGILICEVQQNSDMVYRVYDWNRVDSQGKSRELHVSKALDVIDFSASHVQGKVTGVTVRLGKSERTVYIVCDYFALERLKVSGILDERTDGSRFFTYTVTEGKGSILYGGEAAPMKAGDSFFIPACLGEYRIEGDCSIIKAYIPDMGQVKDELEKQGCSAERLNRIAGLQD